MSTVNRDQLAMYVTTPEITDVGTLAQRKKLWKPARPIRSLYYAVFTKLCIHEKVFKTVFPGTCKLIGSTSSIIPAPNSIIFGAQMQPIRTNSEYA